MSAFKAMIRHPNCLTRLSRRIFGGKFKNTSCLPCTFPIEQEYSFFVDENFSLVIQILKENNNYLLLAGLSLLDQDRQRVFEEETRLNQMKDDSTSMVAQSSHAKGLLTTFPGSREKIPQIPHNPPIKPFSSLPEVLLTIGLSLMLVLGLCQFMGLDLPNLKFKQLPLLAIVLAGAFCINIAEYLGTYRLVLSAMSSQGDKPKFISEKQILWVSLFLVTLETCFAAPGLLDILPPRIASQPFFQLTVYAATGLAAFANILMAWGKALSDLRWQVDSDRYQQERVRQFIEDQRNGDLKEIHARNRALELEEEEIIRELKPLAEQSRAAMKILEKEIKIQYKEVLEQKRIFKIRYEEWENDLLDWLYVNPELIYGRRSSQTNGINTAQIFTENGANSYKPHE